ncbi:MAG: hypothetical protein MRECE_23c016 [Mycoplasmataceae bacterium CE_OT135]|nr:MAG: hypothetical protein MRECE_23c016 [Mycoplasmataceae bacterium CE_OT135]
MDDKKITKIEEVLNGKETNKPRAEQTLRLLETELKNLIQQKKELKAKFQSKFQEINQWFTKEWQKATKLENKMILLWDYWQREVEILTLQKQIQGQVLATERQENVKKLDKLIALNAGLEKGFKERNIDPELMKELRKKIGAWE